MPEKASPWYDSVLAVFLKDALCELRTRYALGALAMFALVTLSSISMTIAGTQLSPTIAAMVLWIIIFFSAMAGLARSFVQEEETGTLFALRLYVRSGAVLAGKMLFNILLLQVVTSLLVPLFVILLDVGVNRWSELLLVLFFGTIGITAVTTLTALMVARSGAKGSLITVISFPVLLPQFLATTMATGQILADTPPGWQELTFLAGYDASMLAVALLLFDYLWYD